jgi:pimeloyl-ACP methyl ester carboxylesterase
VYRAVRGTARLVGDGAEAICTLLPDGDASLSPRREAFLAALNGVFGDHLAATGNPLAIPMARHVGGRGHEPSTAPTGRILVLVHGLAMNDLQWARHGHDHGQALARDAGYTPVYLHYNSGLHVSQNGRAFSELLDNLIADWPVPVQELVIIGHSMGGLVARSACHVGEGRPWRRPLTALVCLGTPHHGAPLERGGRLVDGLLGVSAFAAPLARLGQARSAGITDLRFGNVQDADWQRHATRHAQTRDDRVPTPLPRGVKCYLVAAVKARNASSLHAATIGDGLVPLRSALGEHEDRRLALRVPLARRKVIASANHWDLLSSAKVYAQLKSWLVKG